MIRRFLARRRLEHGFAFITTLLAVGIIGVVTFVVHQNVRRALERGLSDRATAIASSIGAVATPSLLAYNYPALQLAAESAIGDPALLYVVIHDKESQIAGVAGTTLFEGGVPPIPEAVVAPLARKIELWFPETGPKPALEAVVPVLIEGGDLPWGTVRVGMGFESVEAELRRLDLGMAITGIALIGLALLASRWLAGITTAPLRRLADGTMALAMGDTAYRVPVSGARELVELAQAFNSMMDRVQEKAAESAAWQRRLADLNATLEEQVRERTRALQESEEQYRSLVEHSPDSILILQRGLVRFANRAFEETFGVTAARARQEGLRLERLFEPPHGEVVAARIAAWEAGEPAGAAEVVALDAAGRRRAIELRGSRIEYLGAPAAECLLVDMTEAKRLRQRLDDTERLRALGELSSGVAHDFNNLLGAILGRIQLLRGRGFEPGVDRDMAVIETAALDGRETVRRIQEFSRQRTDRPLDAVSLGAILEDAIEITRTRWKTDAARRNLQIAVRLEREEGLPSILGNATELREVYTNLILNAVDAMPAGGELTLRCRLSGDRLRTEVEDSGLGMTEDVRRHLFDPFFTTKGLAGTGLGMSVAYGIVSRHSGTIEVDSRLGEGTRFVIEFPVGPEREPADRPQSSERVSAPARRGRILVIDDEEPIAELLHDALSAEGHSVEIVHSGIEGVERAARERHDLVLSDLGMPDLSGWEVARRIRERCEDLPVVLVTGWGTTLDPVEVERHGIAAVVHKPFEIRELLDAVNGALRRAPLARSL